MGSQPPLSQEPADAAVAPAEKCKRRKQAHERHVTASSAPAPPPSAVDPDTTQPDWWEPQPHATLDPNELQDRPHTPLAQCLSCALCGGLLQEAMAAVECGHTYCYDCIERRVEIGGNHNGCPVAGCGAVLGPNPFDHHRLMYDSLLDTLVQKIFPRPQLDAALSARRAEREAATREARAAVNQGGSHRTPSTHHPHPHPHKQHPNEANQGPQQQQQQQPQSSHRKGQGTPGRGQQHEPPQKPLAIRTGGQGKQRHAPPGSGAGAGRAGAGYGRGGISSDGGEEGDDEGSDQELRLRVPVTPGRVSGSGSGPLRVYR